MHPGFPICISSAGVKKTEKKSRTPVSLLFFPSKAVAKNANSVNGKNVNSPIVGLFGGKLLLPSVYLRIQFPGEKKKNPETLQTIRHTVCTADATRFHLVGFSFPAVVFAF